MGHMSFHSFNPELQKLQVANTHTHAYCQGPYLRCKSTPYGQAGFLVLTEQGLRL